MALFEVAVEYGQDLFRNIPGILVSQNLFDDLSDDPINWAAANDIECLTHPSLSYDSIIQRGFDYNKNSFINYPFEKITATRYSDGSFACWYGSETLETTIFETIYHWIQYIQDAFEAFENENIIDVDRRVGHVYCSGLAFDLTSKANEYPWLIGNDYIHCQNLGKRISQEGHPLLRVPSARHETGINVAAFNSTVLSNARDNCYLRYELDLTTFTPSVYRGKKQIHLDFSFYKKSLSRHK